MSETIQKLSRALSQAQTFAKDTPLEALARAQLVLRQANAAKAHAAGTEAEQLASIAAMAASNIEKYQAQVASWDDGVRARAALFHKHEVERLQQPIASKI